MDDEDLVPCGCEWKYVAVELFMKYKADVLAQYDRARNCIGQPSVRNRNSYGLYVANERSSGPLYPTSRGPYQHLGNSGVLARW
jgi:hypothetical protein